MNSTEMVTDFVIRRDWYETPVGTFDSRQLAEEACKRSDFDPAACIVHKVEMTKVSDLIAALNAHCGKMAEEYDFCLSPSIRYDNPGATVPQTFWKLIAYAVEGSNEGYYVHAGAIIGGRRKGEPSIYIDFGFAKTWTVDVAFRMAREAQRFLTATLWN